uniref:hypothetical protein n=1 Tax=Aliarcobacter sp. TaxID=2321116 RepID=UPI0040488B70
MYIEIYELLGLLFTAFSAGFALAKYLNKTITEKRISCSVIEKAPKEDGSRFGENTRVTIFYQNTKPKNLICSFQKKNLFFAPTCKISNSKCIYF